MRLWFAIFVFAFPGFAADFTPLSISSMARRADLIVRARVESKSVARDARGRVLTELKLAISEVWKGNPKQPILTVVHSGGILGEQKELALGQANYQIGEELIGFYLWNERGEAITLAMQQGKLGVNGGSVEKDGKAISLTQLKTDVLEALK